VDDLLHRLAWALPPVLLLGAVAILVLDRLKRLPGASDRAPRLLLQASLALSERTRAHLLHVDGQRWLVVEAEAGITTTPLGDSKAPAAAFWRRLHTGEPR